MQKKIKIIKTHHSNGAIKSTSYVNSLNHGMETAWRENGEKEWESMWKCGKKHGMSAEWYDDGTKWSEDMWRGGKEHGMSTEWYESGEKQREIYRYHDQEVGRMDWDENGDVTRVIFTISHSTPKTTFLKTHSPQHKQTTNRSQPNYQIKSL